MDGVGRGKGMVAFKTRDEQEIDRIIRLQEEQFDEFVQLFDPPLPKGWWMSRHYTTSCLLS